MQVYQSITMAEVEVTIHDVAFGGAGVGRLPDGKIIFIPFTITGERVRAEVIKSTKGYSEAELIEVLEPSPHRVSAPCIYFGHCGGCEYQHIAYEEQVRIKEKQVKDTLTRIGGFKNLPQIQVVPAKNQYGYRNKITVHSGRDRELGFFATDQRTIVDIEKCIISKDAINEKLAAFRKSGARPRHHTIVDSTERIDTAEGVFHQVNSEMAGELLKWVRKLVEAAGFKEHRLLDLYCGTGFFSLGLADLFQQVMGVDQNGHSIHYATLQSKSKGISNAQFYATSVEERIKWFMESMDASKSVVLVDPPREGLTPQVIQEFQTRPPSVLYYVSCNPATLSRDLKKLISDPDAPKYELTALGLFDMFPQTAQIEVIAELKKK